MGIYRYLAYLQEVTMGVEVMLDCPGIGVSGGSVAGVKHDLLYWQAKKWLEGEEFYI